MEPERAAAETPRSIPWSRILSGVGALVALLVLGRQLGGYLPHFAAWVDTLGIWGSVVFIVGYAAAVVAFVPGSVLTLAAGAIFGLAEGVVYVFIAAVLGSSAAFLIARYVARSALEARLAGNARFATIDRAIGEQGRKIVLLLRLSPLVPFTLLNYALGLTTVRFGDYLLASVGMLPGSLLYVYYGKLAGDVATVAGGATMEKDTGYYVVLLLGLVATIVVTTIITRIARRSLSEITGE
jgi:uncharacterized membrane protein YdjX (TVP38/TMEM64 family)